MKIEVFVINDISSLDKILKKHIDFLKVEKFT